MRSRMLVARLALEAGRAVSVEGLIDGLWGDEPPSGNALQAIVSRLRKALSGVGTVELTAGGYRLPKVEVDARRFEELAGRGRRELAEERYEAAAATLAAALGLWRGAALADVLDAPFAQAAAARFDDLRLAVTEDLFDAEIRAGRHADVLSDLEAAGGEHPLSERLAALRMRALAAAGRQSDALAVYERMRERLGDELGIDPSAELRETHLALLRGELEQTAARPEPVLNRLPGQLTSFLGRDGELARLAEALKASRLTTIVGPGGAGKTRLSLEAVTHDPTFRRGRVWFVPLASVDSPDHLVDMVSRALDGRDLQSAGGTYDPSATPLDRLVGKLDVGAGLLVLDNCEHLIEAAATLADRLLDRLPSLRILATSREPLAMTGESLFQLGPLALPHGVPEPAEAAESPAVQLFLDRARDIRPDFVLDARTVTPVVEICRQLDGIPLALELAAAKLRAMGVEQIARRLDDRFRLLTTGSRTALPRQRTLHALVEWSWDLLEEPERVLARRLAMFPGGANIDALESICSDGSLPAADVPYVLDALVEKSIVQVSEAEQPRYRMLETIRAFAAERLARSGDDFTERFADYFVALAQTHEPALRTREQLDAIAVFDADHENMVVALRHAVDTGDAELTARFVRALFWYWGMRGMSTAFDTYLSAALNFGAALPAATRAAFQVVRLMSGGGNPDTADAQSPRALIEEVVAVEAMDFHPALPLWIPMLAYGTGNPDLGERELLRALEHPDPWVRASAHWARDYALTESGDLRSGAADRLAALREFEATGDRWGMGIALLVIGRDHSLRGEYDRATATFERCVAVAAELGMEDDIFTSRARLAAERMRAGDLASAARDIAVTQRQARERGYGRMGAVILFSVAESQRRAGDVDAAEGTLDQLEERVHRLLYPEQIARDQITAARMANRIAAGEAVRARELLPHTVRGAFAIGEAEPIARAAELIARLLLLEDDPEGAAVALGLSEVVRGVFDAGEPELRQLTEELTKRLGENSFRAAYQRGARTPRADALNRLAEFGQPVTA
ncbi:BTAD domain-containing putative transcriptional regulator [Nocardia sp. NPDC050406]|uniref:BTAD domain-containing putative transcriptional regulator n=1 Tax=Nocardia sp. NPDC050406 TaxID=3364318 RepID=UPI0037AC4F3F